MDDFFPFIYIPKKEKELDPEPLYIELIEPLPQKLPQQEPDTNDQNPSIIIIEL